MSRQIYSRAANVIANHVPAANTAAVVTIAADANHVWDIRAVYASYTAAPTNGSLDISIGGVSKYNVPVTDSGIVGKNGILFALGDEEDGLHGTYNQAVVVTLAAGGVGINGAVNVLYR